MAFGILRGFLSLTQKPNSPMVGRMASKKFPPALPQSRKSRTLKQQLEQTRLERAFEIAADLAAKGALLTAPELARLNEVVTGSRSTKEDAPWRQEEVTLTLPSGKRETLSVIVNARRIARDKLHRAVDLADCGSVLEAAIGLYVGLVQSHVFTDGNRRTAAVAAHYFFARHNIPISGLSLHELGTGDMRDLNQIQELESALRQIAKFSSKRKEKE